MIECKKYNPNEKDYSIKIIKEKANSHFTIKTKTKEERAIQVQKNFLLKHLKLIEY